jgi:hypothetical protein
VSASTSPSISPEPVVEQIFEAIVVGGITVSAEASCRALCFADGGSCQRQARLIGQPDAWLCVCFADYFGRTCTDRRLRLDSLTPTAAPLAGGVAIAMLGARLSEAMFFLDDVRVGIDIVAAVAAATDAFVNVPVTQGSRADATTTPSSSSSSLSQRRRLASWNWRQAASAAGTKNVDRRSGVAFSTRQFSLADSRNSPSQPFFTAPPSATPGPRNVTLLLPVVPRQGEFDYAVR